MAANQQIIINPRGRFANQMFQLMLALSIKVRLGKDIKIAGYNLDDWGLRNDEKLTVNEKHITLRWNNFNLSQAVYLLENEIINTVIIDGWGMRLENFEHPKTYADLFLTNASYQTIQDDEILINIRCEDILSGWHQLYYPLPFAFYRKVIAVTGLKPVFMGQLESNLYTDDLRRNFPDAKFLAQQSIIEDFQTIRMAKHIAISISSFAWLASWISESAETIHYPICGLLNPSLGAMLMPAGDQRYKFYDVPFLAKAQRNEDKLIDWVNFNHQVNEAPSQVAQKYVRLCMFPAHSDSIIPNPQPI